MAILREHLAISQFRLPSFSLRRLLAYLHSGEVMKHALPRCMRIVVVAWAFSYCLAWCFLWPLIYRDFERWGLVKAFFALMIALLTALAVTGITILRAGHLEDLPEDDFAVLRSTAVFCRWLAEAAMVFALGMSISSLLQPMDNVLLSNLRMQAGSVTGHAALSAAVGGVPILAVLLWLPVCLFLYAVANAIDLSLAIEYNTRGYRSGNR